jgi:hypothetical protein
MDKRSRIFFIYFSVLILIVIGVSFVKYFILKDYYIKIKVACNPITENCFVSDLDDGTNYSTDNVSKNFNFYKIVRKKASSVSFCEHATDCFAVTCEKDEDCREVTCNLNIVPAGEHCSKIENNN